MLPLLLSCQSNHHRTYLDVTAQDKVFSLCIVPGDEGQLVFTSSKGMQSMSITGTEYRELAQHLPGTGPVAALASNSMLYWAWQGQGNIYRYQNRTVAATPTTHTSSFTKAKGCLREVRKHTLWSQTGNLPNHPFSLFIWVWMMCGGRIIKIVEAFSSRLTSANSSCSNQKLSLCRWGM